MVHWRDIFSLPDLDFYERKTPADKSRWGLAISSRQMDLAKTRELP
jgi:hypothetical protein